MSVGVLSGSGGGVAGTSGGLEVRIVAPTAGMDALPCRVPYRMTLTGWELVADTPGSVVLDVWADTFAHFPPTVGDTIAGTGKPTLAAAQTASGGIAGWDRVALLEGERLWVHVNSASGLGWAVLSLFGLRSS